MAAEYAKKQKNKNKKPESNNNGLPDNLTKKQKEFVDFELEKESKIRRTTLKVGFFYRLLFFKFFRK